MPPKKKNAPKNAFFYFMKEFKEREEARGRVFDEKTEVASAAGLEWQGMSAEQRKPYDMLKEQQKSKKKEKKYTALGEDINVFMKREQDLQHEKKNMIKNIEDVVANGNDYVTKNFFIAHVNHYCYCNSQNRHIPAEISIIRFTLQNGVDLDDCYHVILDTGNLPIGYRLAAITVSEESHLIPVPPHEDEIAKISEKNIKKAYLSMTDFLRKTMGQRERLPPVYVDDLNFEMAKDIFKNLYEQYDVTNVYNEIQVYSLSHLFYVLRNAAHSRVSTEKAFPFATIPQTELEKDVYDYVKGIACQYHNTTDDAYPHCTLSKCIRKAFIICDHTCADLNIKLIPGLHIPKNAKKQKLEERPPFQESKAWKTVPNNNSGPSSSVPNGVCSYASTTSTAVETVTQNVAGLSVQKASTTSNQKPSYAATSAAAVAASPAPAAAAASPAPAATSASTSRKPQTMSMAMTFKRNQAPDLMNDFPALGDPRPVSLGRGRGRVQTVKPNNENIK